MNLLSVYCKYTHFFYTKSPVIDLNKDALTHEHTYVIENIKRPLVSLALEVKRLIKASKQQM